MTKELRGNDGGWRPMSISHTLKRIEKENVEIRALLARLIGQLSGPMKTQK
jgi:hypothetical protein